MVRIGRGRTRRDDDAFGAHDEVVADLQVVVVHEPGHAPEAVLVGNAVDGFEYEADKPVALAAHALHDGVAVDTRLVDLNAERRRLAHGMSCLGGRNQQLAWHAADAGTGRAVGAPLDENDAAGPLAGGAIGGQPGRTGADDGDVYVSMFHRYSLSLVGSELIARLMPDYWPVKWDKSTVII